jgi:hypothetical protein
MKFFTKSLQNYLLIGFPFVITCAVWQFFVSERTIAETASGLTTFTWDVLSWNVMMWFAALVVFLVTLLMSPSFRGDIVSRLANIQDRDEHEAQITGAAAKSTFVATLSFMIVLLFCSTFSLSFSPIPANQQYDGKTRQVHVSMNFRLFDESASRSPAPGSFNSRDFSPSASACLMALIAWQLISFRRSARKESRLQT